MVGTMVRMMFPYCKLHEFLGDEEPTEDCVACWSVYYQMDKWYHRNEKRCGPKLAFRKALRQLYGPMSSWRWGRESAPSN